jgi:hypothetical protein
MGPIITLYILGGCVAVAALLFVVMIVLSVARPPRLPDISTYTPPLERVMRALTPIPVAVPFEAASAHAKPARTMPPRPPPMPAIAATAQAYAVPSIPPPYSPPSAPVAAAAISPAVGALAFAPTVAAPQVPPAVALPRVASVKPPLARSPITLPTYPARRGRKLMRFFVVMLVMSAVAFGAAVASPAMLDPLCDDYDWFGSDATSVVREQARDAHAAIADLLGL